MISVILPVYNSEKTLERCIDSILRQTYTQYEIIVVNDGSTDSSKAIIERYSESDNRIVSIEKANGGVGSARNIGIERAKGEYVCFVDSDDYVAATYIEELYNCITSAVTDLALCLISRSEDLVSHENTQYDENNSLIRSIINNDEHNAGPYNKLFKRDIIGNLRFAEDIYLGEDTLFCVEYAKKCKSAVRVNKVLYFYDVPTSTSLYVTDKSKLRRNLTVIDSRKRMLEKVNMLDKDTVDAIKDSYRNMCFYNAVLGVTYNDFFMIKSVADELRDDKDKFYLSMNWWLRLLRFNPILFYLIKKMQLKSEALMFHVEDIVK